MLWAFVDCYQILLTFFDCYQMLLNAAVIVAKLLLPACRGIRDDIEKEDDQESYFKAMANAPIIVGDDDEDDWEYDEDGNPIPPERSKVGVPCVDQRWVCPEWIKSGCALFGSKVGVSCVGECALFGSKVGVPCVDQMWVCPVWIKCGCALCGSNVGVSCVDQMWVCPVWILCHEWNQYRVEY